LIADIIRKADCIDYANTHFWDGKRMWLVIRFKEFEGGE